MLPPQTFGNLVPQRFNVGLSAIFGITNMPGQLSVSIEYYSGGTLEIVNPNASISWGQGWIIPTGSIVSIDTNSIIYLASSGTTTTIGVLIGQRQGFFGASLGYRG